MKNVFLFLTFFLSALFFSCGKDIVYPEGGNSKHADKKLKRMWTIVQYTVDGIDSLASLDSHLLNHGAFNFYHHNVRHAIFDDAGVNMLDIYNGQYGVEFDRQYLKLLAGPQYIYPPFSINSNYSNEWEILELTNDIVKLRLVLGKEYVIVLK